MIVIHLVRKPLTGTVAQNVLQWGTGALNIDGCRLVCGTEHMRYGTIRRNQSALGDTRVGPSAGSWGVDNEFQATNHPAGRWPANFVLEHLQECQYRGVCKALPTSTSGHGPIRRTGVHSEVGGHQTIGRQQPPIKGYADLDGTETIDAWDCVPGCPVKDMDKQSGITQGIGGASSGSSAFGQNSGWNAHNNQVTFIERRNDVGGASRFFKQVQGTSE